MGFFKDVRGAMGQATAAAAQGRTMGAGVLADPVGAMGDRRRIEEQAAQDRRVRAAGAPGRALIRGHVDTGERAAGNPVWLLDLEVTPAGGEPYAVEHRAIVPRTMTAGYAAGSSYDVKIDPADPRAIAFG